MLYTNILIRKNKSKDRLSAMYCLIYVIIMYLSCTRQSFANPTKVNDSQNIFPSGQEKLQVVEAKKQEHLLNELASYLKWAINEELMEVGKRKKADEIKLKEYLSTIINNKEIWNKLKGIDEGVETIYWYGYQMNVPVEELVFARAREKSKTLSNIIFQGDWQLLFYKDLDLQKDWLSINGHELFEEICHKFSLSDNTISELKEKLKNKMLFNSDYDLFSHVWNKGWSIINIEKLTVAELFEAYYATIIKLEVTPQGHSGRWLFPIKEVETDFMKGFAFGLSETGLSDDDLIIKAFDNYHNLDISFINDHGRRIGQVNLDIVKQCISTLQVHQSKTPAKDMLNTAQRYLQMTPNPLPHVAMVFIKSAQQYKADNETEERIKECQEQAIEKLIANLQHKDKKMRVAAAIWLGELGVKSAQDSLIAAINDKEARVREWAVYALGNIAPEKNLVLPLLLEKLEKDNDELVRAATVGSLWHMCDSYGTDDTIVKKLISAYNDKSPIVRERVIRALNQIEPDPAIVKPLYLKALKDKDEKVREWAKIALSEISSFDK